MFEAQCVLLKLHLPGWSAVALADWLVSALPPAGEHTPRVLPSTVGEYPLRLRPKETAGF